MRALESCFRGGLARFAGRRLKGFSEVLKKPILKVLEGPAKGKEFAVQDGFVIGRSEECQIHTNDPTTSRKHAQINKEKDGYRLVDLESANGLLINQRQLKSHFLRHGDKVTMGDTTFLIEFIIDPKVKRRNFRIFLVVLILAAGAALFQIWQQNEALRRMNEPIIHEFTQLLNIPQYDVQMRVPGAMGEPTFTYEAKRPWSRSRLTLWGADYPQVYNQLATDSVVLDGYLRASGIFVVDEDRYEFYRFDLEVCDGLQTWGRLADYGIGNTSLPQNTSPSNLTLKEIADSRGVHPTYGDYEEWEWAYEAFKDDDGKPVMFHAKQRVYVIGRRRFALTAVTNERIKNRVDRMFDTYIEEGVVIDVEAAKRRPAASNETLFAEGTELAEQAARMNQDATGIGNKKYRAFLRRCAAIGKFKQMTQTTRDFDQSMQAMRALKAELQGDLERRRDEIRDHMNNVRFAEAQEQIKNLEIFLDIKEEPYAMAEKDEWIIWADAARKDVVREENFRKNMLIQRSMGKMP